MIVIKGRKFNFFAALFGQLWMAYHFMIGELLLISVIDIVVYSGGGVFLTYNFGHLFYAKAIGNVCTLLYILIKFIVFGVMGNFILEENLTRYEQKGKASIVSYLRKSEKNIVFRGVAVVLDLGYIILLNYEIIPFLVDWLIY